MAKTLTLNNNKSSLVKLARKKKLPGHLGTGLKIGVEVGDVAKVLKGAKSGPGRKVSGGTRNGIVIDYSKFKNGERQLMFIGKNEDGAINYARTPGAKDKSPRQKRNQMIKNVAKGAAAVGGAVAAARYGGAGLAQKGLNRKLKGSALTAGQKVGSVRQGAVNAVRSDVGKVGSAISSGKKRLGQARDNFAQRQQSKRKKKTQTMKIANQMRNQGG
jgi:hypothetical protein